MRKQRQRGYITRDPQGNKATSRGRVCTKFLKKWLHQGTDMPPCFVFWLLRQTANSHAHGSVKQAGKSWRLQRGTHAGIGSRWTRGGWWQEQGRRQSRDSRTRVISQKWARAAASGACLWLRSSELLPLCECECSGQMYTYATIGLEYRDGRQFGGW